MRNRTPPRSALVHVLIWLAVFLATLCGGEMIFQRSQRGVSLEVPDESLWVIQPFLAGETVHVPESSGFWLEHHAQAQTLVLRGNQIGQTQTIGLCEQRKLTREDPMQIYPVRVVEKFALGRERNPVLVSSDLAAGMPRLTIRGRATDQWPPASLQLALEDNGGRWRLVSDLVQGGGNASKADFAQQAWLLWQSKESATREEDLRFDRAMLIEQRRPTPCEGRLPAGKLEFSIFRADTEETATPAPHPAQMVVFPAKGGAYRTRVHSGEHDFPATKPVFVEDKSLFDEAVANGLIRLSRDGRIEAAPIDLIAARSLGQAVEGWEQVSVSESSQHLLKRLYGKADGAIVRAQIRRFNRQRWWAAIRLRTADSEANLNAVDPRYWRASVDGVDTSLSTDMPDVAARLFDTPPSGWSPWLRVVDWPESANESSRVRLLLPPLPKRTVELLVLGRISTRQGMRIVSRRDACFGPGCPSPDLLQHIVLEITDPDHAMLEVRADPRFAALDPAIAGFRHIRVEQGRLVWKQQPVSLTEDEQRIEVNISARDGEPLVAASVPTRLSSELGLRPIVGISATHTHSLIDMLSRLAPHNHTTTDGRLSIDPALQRLAQQVLWCSAHLGRVWNAANNECGETHLEGRKSGRSGKTVVDEDPGRRSNLVILDAGNGDILAAASTPELPKEVPARDLIDFDRVNPARSPLSPTAWRHAGGVELAAGSSFKMIAALGLELAAQRSREIEALLDGSSPRQIDAISAARGDDFSMSGGCYPMPCGKRRKDGSWPVENHDLHRPIAYAENGRFGVRQALAYSLNTWFAWMSEMSDGTLVGQNGGRPDTRPLGDLSLDALRPVSAMAHRLGFGRAMKLDGFLLPDDYAWQPDDVLASTPSLFDPVLDRHQIRKQAIGSRMQVTPLQMAVVAASIGEGHVVTPRLLLELDGRNAQEAPRVDIGVRLDRVRAGMKDVPEHGTARSTFAASEQLKALSRGVHAKTGSAGNQAVGGNISWFSGYVEPNTLPGETRRLAFAVYISRSPLTGGAHAAPVMAGVLESLALRRQ